MVGTVGKGLRMLRMLRGDSGLGYSFVVLVGGPVGVKKQLWTMEIQLSHVQSQPLLCFMHSNVDPRSRGKPSCDSVILPRLLKCLKCNSSVL